MAEDAKRRRGCTGGDGDDVLSALPEHVLREVLSRVGTVKDLFKLAATCRRWLGRFTDRTFLREMLYFPGQQGLLLGFFLQDACSGCSFLPAPGSPLGARALTSSLSLVGGGAVPLAARRGIVLLQRVRRRGTDDLLLGVCNPVTGQHHLLPPLGCRDPTDMCGYAIITAADDGFTFSRLLVATVDPSDWAVHLHSYSAATRRWSAPPTLCPVNARCLSPAGQRSAVVHQGAAHWLWLGARARAKDDGSSSSLYKLSVQLGGAAEAEGPMCFAFTRIPVRGGGNPLLCVTGDGKLAVVCVYISHVAVSTCLEAGGESTWERTAFTIPAALPYPGVSPLWQPKEKWFELSRGGSMLVLYRSSAVFVLDLHSKTVEKVMDCFLPLFADKLNRTAVPYEMDLVDFFMIKLGGLSRSFRIDI
ncbi:unnamed protein product [Urochloa humidicola]